jgi:hypothetical protein
MDLNQLYSEHQVSLMRAAGALSQSARRKYLCAAGLVGGQIFELLSSKNAPASVGWSPWANRLVPIAGLAVPA